MKDDEVPGNVMACTERFIDESLRVWQTRWRGAEKRMVKTVCEYAMKRLEEEISRFEKAPASLAQLDRRSLSKT
jgi:hypothetical protein